MERLDHFCGATDIIRSAVVIFKKVDIFLKVLLDRFEMSCVQDIAN